MPTSNCPRPRGRGEEGPGQSDIQSSEQVALPLGSPVLGLPLLPQPQAPEPTVGKDFASSLFLHTVCSNFAWLSEAWGIDVLLRIQNFQPAG